MAQRLPGPPDPGSRAVRTLARWCGLLNSRSAAARLHLVDARRARRRATGGCAAVGRAAPAHAGDVRARGTTAPAPVSLPLLPGPDPMCSSASTGSATGGSHPTWRSLVSRTSSCSRPTCRASSTSGDRRPTWSRVSPRCSIAWCGEDTASYKPFRDADELHDLVLDDLAILLTERFDGDREAAPVPAQLRHNLPAQTSTFLGREAELRRPPTSHRRRGHAARLAHRSRWHRQEPRLAIRAAFEERRHASQTASIFADLSAAREADDTFDAVARAVGVVRASERRPA